MKDNNSTMIEKPIEPIEPKEKPEKEVQKRKIRLSQKFFGYFETLLENVVIPPGFDRRDKALDLATFITEIEDMQWAPPDPTKTEKREVEVIDWIAEALYDVALNLP
jgi:hypothetical protein